MKIGKKIDNVIFKETKKYTNRLTNTSVNVSRIVFYGSEIIVNEIFSYNNFMSSLRRQNRNEFRKKRNR